jgi:hypothetical protein
VPGILHELAETHPSREEWEARKAALPADARQALERIAERKARVRTESRLQAARELAEADEWRAKFEAAVSAALAREGAGWLVGFRVPDHKLPDFVPFRSASETFSAVFDASACGLWPIVLTLTAGTGHAREWSAATQAWKVSRPRGLASYRDFALALEVAAAHCTPF